MDLFTLFCVFMFLTYIGILASLYLITVLLTTDGIGYVSLHRAVKNGDLKVIKQCLKKGDDVNKVEWYNGRSPMHFYRSDDWNDEDLEILKILMDHGASVTLLDDEGKAAFEYLITFGDRRTLQILLQYDLDLSARDVYDRTPLHFLMEHCDPHIHELIKDKKFDVNARDSEYGFTALSIAVTCCAVNKVEFLLEHGADANIADNDGETPLYSAVWDTEPFDKETMKIVNLLLEHGADAQQLLFEEETENVAASFFVESVIAHLAMIETQGEVLTKFAQIQINSKLDYQDYFVECKRQLEEMKKMIVYESVTLYKLLTENPNRIVHYTLNRGFSWKFDRILRSMIDKLDTYYYHLLRRRVGKAIQRAQIKTRAAAAVCELTGFDFTSHRTIVTKITDYLNAGDLKGLHDDYDEEEILSLECLFI